MALATVSIQWQSFWPQGEAGPCAPRPPRPMRFLLVRRRRTRCECVWRSGGLLRQLGASCGWGGHGR